MCGKVGKTLASLVVAVALSGTMVAVCLAAPLYEESDALPEGQDAGQTQGSQAEPLSPEAPPEEPEEEPSEDSLPAAPAQGEGPETLPDRDEDMDVLPFGAPVANNWDALAAAIAAASPGDELELTGDTASSSMSSSITITQDITIDGMGFTLFMGLSGWHFQVENGATLTLRNVTLTGGGNGGLRLDNGHLQASNVHFEGLRYRTGNNYGVALNLQNGSTATLENCSFVRCTNGPAINANGGGLTLNGCLFEDNENYNTSIGDTYGACVLARQGDIVITGTRFVNNRSSSGAAIYSRFSNASITVEDCHFEGNAATYRGGAIYVDMSVRTPLAVRGSTFVNNNATLGGAMHLSSSADATIEGCDFLNNTARDEGGALVLYVSMHTDIRNSRFVGNSAPTQGGAISMNGTNCQLRMRGTTLENNHTDGKGGAVYIEGMYRQPNLLLLEAAGPEEGSVLRGNSAGQGGGAIYVEATGYENLYFSHTRFEGNTAGGGLRVLVPEDSEYPALAALQAGTTEGALALSSPVATLMYNNHDISLDATGDWHSVTLHANHGQGGALQMLLRAGQLPLWDSPFTQDGYLFAGWNTSADGSGTAYTPGDTIALTGAVSLYAQWHKVQAPDPGPSPDPTPNNTTGGEPVPATGDVADAAGWAYSMLGACLLLCVLVAARLGLRRRA